MFLDIIIQIFLEHHCPNIVGASLTRATLSQFLMMTRMVVMMRRMVVMLCGDVMM